MSRSRSQDSNRPVRRSCPVVTRLEDRTTPSAVANFTPESRFLMNPAWNAAFTNPGPIQPVDIGLSFLGTHAAELGLAPGDLNDAQITNLYQDHDTGIYHLYLRQQVNGLAVSNADFSIAITAGGQVISAGGGFVTDLQNQTPALRTSALLVTATEAVRLAASEVGIASDGSVRIVNGFMGPVKSPPTNYEVTAPTISADTIPVELLYSPTADGAAAPSWHMVIDGPPNTFWGEVSVDAMTGEVVFVSNYVDDAGYQSVPLPTNESPQDGGFATVVNPADPLASPFGWHDTNGVAGAESTLTIGNNVDSHLDRDANNTPDASPPRPDGGANLDFSSFTFDPAQGPLVVQNQNAAMVNLFHANNVIHDIHYQYGFTEAAGNFQLNNYGRGGLGNDRVNADAQDGSGTNNANFGTPVDGSSPRMQMYIWTAANPDRDSDLDNGVIIHEYGHGVSNRLTGGPANVSALNNTQSGGMGEGWGDWWALMFTQRATDTINGSHGIGTYVNNQAQTGTGIRIRPYSYNMTTNPLMWDSYGTSGTTSYGITRSTAVHRTGTVWATTLWDMNWLLINKYGYDSNLYTGWSPNPGPANAGNKLALRLVMEGLKLQPANPSFTQARDAIIAADIALNGGKDLFEIWSAFARRGLGQGSSSGASSSTALVTISTTLPMLVSSVVPATGGVVSAKPASYVVNVTSAINPSSLQASDLVVNGQPATGVSYTPGATSATFTFDTDPVTAEGNQTISIAAGAFTRASDSSAVAVYGSNFFFDTTPVTVTSISPAPNTNVPLPLTTIDVNLNQAINPASVQTTDLSISRGTVTGFSMLNGNTTVRFTVDNLTTPQTITVAVAAGAFQDADGNPNAAFAGGNYTLVVTPQVSGVGIDDGTAQRSLVRSLTVSFSQIVNFQNNDLAGAFSLLRTNGGSVSFAATSSNATGVTVVTLNGFTGADTQFGSLADGRYTLTAVASRVTNAGGQQLNGGNDYSFGEAQGLFRLFGDINGSRRVDLADYGLFSTTYNKALGESGYISAFDFDGSNRINLADYGQFSLRYLADLP